MAVRAEENLAAMTPVWESQYALNRVSSLALYDCFLPRLKQYLEVKPSCTKEHEKMMEQLRIEKNNLILQKNEEL